MRGDLELPLGAMTSIYIQWGILYLVHREVILTGPVPADSVGAMIPQGWVSRGVVVSQGRQNIPIPYVPKIHTTSHQNEDLLSVGRYIARLGVVLVTVIVDIKMVSDFDVHTSMTPVAWVNPPNSASSPFYYGDDVCESLVRVLDLWWCHLMKK